MNLPLGAAIGGLALLVAYVASRGGWRQRRESAWHTSDVAVFVLAFEPVQTRCDLRSIQTVFVNLARLLPSKYGQYYQNWNASLHCDQGYAHLWLRFKFDVSRRQEFLSGLEGEIGGMAGPSDFRLGGVYVETDAQSFGQGAPRRCDDVFSGVGGSRMMPQLWHQMQTATEWAADALNGATGHQPSADWFCYACHLYWNLIGKECGAYGCPSIRLSACPVYSRRSGRPWP